MLARGLPPNRSIAACCLSEHRFLYRCGGSTAGFGTNPIRFAFSLSILRPTTRLFSFRIRKRTDQSLKNPGSSAPMVLKPRNESGKTATSNSRPWSTSGPRAFWLRFPCSHRPRVPGLPVSALAGPSEGFVLVVGRLPRRGCDFVGPIACMGSRRSLLSFPV